MSLSKNSIYAKDVSTTPIKLKYDSVYTSSYDGYAEGITFPSNIITVNYARNDSPTKLGPTGSQSILYRSIRHMYYDEYLSASLQQVSGSWNSNRQSTAYSGSSEYEYRYIPTSSAQPIVVMYIPPNLYGEQVSRKTFVLKPIIGSEYNIIDDGNGNLIDIENSNAHVGNIIYSQGVVVITNDFYVPGFIIPTVIPDSYYTPTAATVAYADSYVETSATSQYVQFTP